MQIKVYAKITECTKLLRDSNGWIVTDENDNPVMTSYSKVEIKGYRKPWNKGHEMVAWGEFGCFNGHIINVSGYTEYFVFNCDDETQVKSIINEVTK